MRYVAVICILVVSIAGAAAAADMTHEETVVRTAYAKFAYASEEGVIGQLVVESLPGSQVDKRYAGMTTDQRLAAARVTFALSNFVVGDVKEILDSKAVDLISQPVGDTLSGSIGFNGYNEPALETHWNNLDARWVPVEHRHPPLLDEQVQRTKMAGLYELDWGKPRPEKAWQRYASYSVTVTFQGKSRGPYKALFLFGSDESGNETVSPMDATVSGLFSAMSEHLFPDAFVLTRLRKIPVVMNWLMANQMSGPACSVGQGDVCCDLVKLKCGPGSEDVAQGLSRPWPDASLPVPPPKFIGPEWRRKAGLAEPEPRDAVLEPAPP